MRTQDLFAYKNTGDIIIGSKEFHILSYLFLQDLSDSFDSISGIIFSAVQVWKMRCEGEVKIAGNGHFTHFTIYVE